VVQIGRYDVIELGLDMRRVGSSKLVAIDEFNLQSFCNESQHLGGLTTLGNNAKIFTRDLSITKKVANKFPEPCKTLQHHQYP